MQMSETIGELTAAPVERETWSDWRADTRGWVLCALFVGTVLAVARHVAGVWGA